jgi:hypothetical protein
MMWWLASVAAAQAVDFSCSPSDASGEVLAVPPITVTCELQVSELYDYAAAEWLMGDGTVRTGDSVAHVYETPGQYDVHVYLEGLAYAVGDTGVEAVPPDVPDQVVKRGHVTLCEAPTVEFSYVFKGGLTYEMHNRSDFIAGCVDTIQWAVHEGEGRDGALVAASDTWETTFELPEEGTYTIFLDMGGIAGNAAAKITVEAEGGLTEELDRSPTACATGPLPGAVGGLFLAAAAMVGRRRR